MTNPQPTLALVTGAGTGIGRAISRTLATRGHRVLAVGRRSAPLESLSASLPPGQVVVLSADVSEPDALAHALEATPGRLAVTVACAGTFTRGSVQELSPSAWDEQIRANLTSAFHTLRAATGRMLTQELIDESRGHVFTLNSGAGVVGFPSGSAYAAAKHGLRGLVESLRGELIGQSVKLTDLLVSATVESEMSAGRDVPMIPAAAVAHTVTACLDLGGAANWDRVDLGQLR